MHDAFEADRSNNEQGKPGLRKLMIANEVYSELRKKAVQERFLE
jgi:hypothetical protein